MIEAKILLDSVSKLGARITTFQLKYPRFIHSELMTHRQFSRSASSSRAIPIKKMIEMVKTNPAKPIHWGKNQAGMQALEEVVDRTSAEQLWLQAAKEAASVATIMDSVGLHKQVVNRILEPFQWIHVIVTATEYENFFNLRAHKDAQPEIQALARLMQAEMNRSVPVARDFHAPYITEEEMQNTNFTSLQLCKISSARCARVSYLLHDGSKPDITKDLELFNRLVGSMPVHASPLEHVAFPEEDLVFFKNLKGWSSFRMLYETNYLNTLTRR